MDHAKLDAALASALEAVDDPDAPVLAVFVHVAPGGPLPVEAARLLADMGVSVPAEGHAPTATLSARQVSQLSERAWVGHLRLARRLRPLDGEKETPGTVDTE